MRQMKWFSSSLQAKRCSCAMALLLGLWALAWPMFAEPRINEFLAVNNRGLADRAGVEVPEESDQTSESEDELKGLRERTEEVSETIEEHSEAQESEEEPPIQPEIETKERVL